MYVQSRSVCGECVCASTLIKWLQYRRDCPLIVLTGCMCLLEASLGNLLLISCSITLNIRVVSVTIPGIIFSKDFIECAVNFETTLSILISSFLSVAIRKVQNILLTIVRPCKPKFSYLSLKRKVTYLYMHICLLTANYTPLFVYMKHVVQIHSNHRLIRNVPPFVNVEYCSLPF